MTVRLVLLALLLAGCRPTSSDLVPEARADEAAPGAAVVELFTSEGCSSCPPADAVLTDLGAAPSVYALAFHVDYWDALGWPDPFASPEATARQRAYVESLGGSGLYTPELVVGGTESYVGSDRERARAGVARALAQPARVRLSVRARSLEEGRVAVAIASAPVEPDAVILVALVERDVTTEVRAGENAGRKLRHTHVVRAFRVVPPTEKAVVLAVPPDLARGNAEIVALVQRAPPGGGSMPVLGAARTTIAE